ncbi:MAG: H-NS histone family protein [Candidatus Tectomicrobia bacterium]|nr:H-NS histone family protein [Candidatus Tectomicrobia bacterium]
MDGSSIDWSEYKDEDIQRFIRELEAEQNRRRAEKRKALKAQISDMVKAQGLSLNELFPQPGKSKGQPKGKAQAEAPKVKYRNPDNTSQTWTGMGRKPTWIVEALSSGKTLEDLSI